MKLGFYSSLFVGTTESKPVDDAGNKREWAFLSRLKEFFKVEVYQNPPVTIPDDVKLFIAFHPKDADEKLEYALDQYLMRGGHLILIVDPFSRTELEGKRSTPDQVLTEIPKISSNLPRLFKHWGLTFTDQQIVGDSSRATRIDRVSYAFDYPFYPTFQPTDFSTSHMITASLKQILMAEPGGFEWTGTTPGLTFESLIKTTDKAGLAPITMDGLADHQALEQLMSKERKSMQLAGLIKGRFTSAFTAPPTGVEDKGNFLKEAKTDNTVLVVGDSDFLHEAQVLETVPYGDQMVQRPKNDNVSFLTNATAYLGGAEELVTIRSSGRLQRPFTRLRQLQDDAQARWKAEEDKLAEQLRGLQKNLKDLQKVEPKTGDGKDKEAELTPQQQAELKTARDEELKLRGLLRGVRKNLREDIETLGHRLIALNLLVVPSLVGIMGFLIFWRRGRRSRA